MSNRVLRQRKKSAELICRIDDSGFVAVMFALVAMFWLPAMVVDYHPRDAADVSVDYAKASHSVVLEKALREDALFVAVQRDGKIWFDSDMMTPDKLPAAIRERMRHGAERSLYSR